MAVVLASYEVRLPWRGLETHLRLALRYRGRLAGSSGSRYFHSRSYQYGFMGFLGTLLRQLRVRSPSGGCFSTWRTFFLVVLSRDVLEFLGGCGGR